LEDPRNNRPYVQPGRGQLLKFPATGAGRGFAEANASGELSNADLFALLWQTLADVLGTAAAATLLRRAAQRALAASPELSGLEITRATLEYAYQVPEAWNAPGPQSSRPLCDLVRELRVLLIELTGSVVVARLLQVPELRELGIGPAREQP